MLESQEEQSDVFPLLYLKEAHTGTSALLTQPPSHPPLQGRQVQRGAVSAARQQWAREETG